MLLKPKNDELDSFRGVLNGLILSAILWGMIIGSIWYLSH